eukprot:COSAG05_NODE_5177_length_1244_cov_2.624454_1_plen_149_part_10
MPAQQPLPPPTVACRVAYITAVAALVVAAAAPWLASSMGAASRAAAAPDTAHAVAAADLSMPAHHINKCSSATDLTSAIKSSIIDMSVMVPEAAPGKETDEERMRRWYGDVPTTSQDDEELPEGQECCPLGHGCVRLGEVSPHESGEIP